MGAYKCPADLQEPTKAELLAYEADNTAVPARTAYCIVQAFPKSPVSEVYLDLSGAKASVTSWKQVQVTACVLHPCHPKTMHGPGIYQLSLS